MIWRLWDNDRACKFWSNVECLLRTRKHANLERCDGRLPPGIHIGVVPRIADLLYALLFDVDCCFVVM